MYNRLINYFQKNNVFFNDQFGFRANHSTAQAILLITDKIQNSIEKKLFSCGIFLDLFKLKDYSFMKTIVLYQYTIIAMTKVNYIIY
jgi:retron-type reverse transcriptase